MRRNYCGIRKDRLFMNRPTPKLPYKKIKTKSRFDLFLQINDKDLTQSQTRCQTFFRQMTRKIRD